MKKTIVFIVLFSAFYLSCRNNKEEIVTQTKEFDYAKKDSIITVNNKKTNNYGYSYGYKKNTLLIKFPELNYIDGKANYVYDAVIDEISKFSVYEEEYDEIYKFTKIKREDLGNTAFIFHSEKEPNIIYGFPANNNVFNGNYFNKEIFKKMKENEKPKVKVYVSVYKRDNNSDLKTIVVDSVKLR